MSTKRVEIIGSEWRTSKMSALLSGDKIRLIRALIVELDAHGTLMVGVASTLRTLKVSLTIRRAA